jgi:hypothetical protein
MVAKWAIHKVESLLAHSKGFAASKQYAALGVLPAGFKAKISVKDNPQGGSKLPHSKAPSARQMIMELFQTY